MTATPFDLERLLQPVLPDRFFAEYWERRPLHVQRPDEAYYRSLLTADDLDDIISGHGLRYPAIRLAKGGAFYPPEAYTRDVRHGDEVFSGVPDVEQIFTEYCAGATVTLPALHLAWPALAALRNRLQAQLDHPVHTNAYLTGPRTAGFTPHYDTHEVFVLQIAGRKQWRVYPPPIHLPHRSQPCSPEWVPATKPLMELELGAGDLLYLPRGYVHSTTTAGEASAHVTIGISVYTAVELLADRLPDAAQNPKLREALPIGFASRPEGFAALQSLWAELVELGILGLPPQADQAIEALRNRVLSTQPRTAARFHTMGSAMDADTRLELTSTERPPILEEEGQAVLQLGNRRLRLPAAVKPVLEAMNRAPSFTAASLPDSVPLAARLSLLRYLHGLGAVRIL